MGGCRTRQVKGSDTLRALGVRDGEVTETESKGEECFRTVDDVDHGRSLEKSEMRQGRARDDAVSVSRGVSMCRPPPHVSVGGGILVRIVRGSGCFSGWMVVTGELQEEKVVGRRRRRRNDTRHAKHTTQQQCKSRGKRNAPRAAELKKHTQQNDHAPDAEVETAEKNAAVLNKGPGRPSGSRFVSSLPWMSFRHGGLVVEVAPDLCSGRPCHWQHWREDSTRRYLSAANGSCKYLPSG